MSEGKSMPIDVQFVNPDRVIGINVEGTKPQPEYMASTFLQMAVSAGKLADAMAEIARSMKGTEPVHDLTISHCHVSMGQPVPIELADAKNPPPKKKRKRK